MNKALTIILMMGVIMAVGTNLSCSQNEKSPDTNGKLETQGSTPAVSVKQTMDAFSGKPINRMIYLDSEGKRIYFCCFKSKGDFISDKEKYLAEFRRQGVTLENSPVGN